MATVSTSAPFGALLKRLRLAAGLTQEALAERAGISARAVSDLERDGDRAPRLETVTLLAGALALAADQRSALLAAARPRAEPGRPASAPAPPRRHNLPAALTSFVGREREMANLAALLGQARQVTVVGVGGVGKTRLALERAAQLVAEYPDGVWLVELASLADPALVAPAVAAAIGVREDPSRPIMQSLLAALRDSRLLLLLDNCEHLLDACARLADALLRGCPHVQILATSREALSIGGEVAWRVPSLALPDATARPGPEALLRNDAVRLFVERARAGNPGVQLTERNAPAVAQVCRRLDGIPLALELAAARLGAMTVEQLAARMDQRFRLLTGGSRAALPRQQTLRATLDWSYDLLDDGERALFRRLAVFNGGWTLEAAEAVGAGAGVEASEVLDLLAQLVRKSLVIAEGQEDGGERYGLLETLRQYAGEKLAGSGEAAAAHDRHATYFVELAEKAIPPGGLSVLADWQERLLRREQANLRAAFDWLVERGDVAPLSRLARSVGYFWAASGSFSEGRRQFDAVMALPGLATPTTAWAGMLFCAAFFAGRVGEYAVARRFGEERLAIARQLGDQRLIADALALLGVHALELGEYDAARRLQEQSLAICRQLDDQTLTASVLIRLGQVAHTVGDRATAMTRYTEGLRLARATENHSDVGRALHHLGALALDQGDYQRATDDILASVRVHWQHQHHPWFHFALADAASLAAAEGRPERALRLGGASAAYAVTKGTGIYPSERGRFDRWMATARQGLPAARADAAWAEGLQMPLEAAFAEALAEDDGEMP